MKPIVAISSAFTFPTDTQLAAYEPATRTKYLATFHQFVDWCDRNGLQPCPEVLLGWAHHLTNDLHRTGATVTQYISRLVFFQDTGRLPHIYSPAVHRWVKGAIKQFGSSANLPLVLPSCIVALYHQREKSIMHRLLLFQCLQGLRSGHFVLLNSTHLSEYDITLPPYKKRRVSTLLSVSHIPKDVLLGILSLTADMHTPFVSMTVEQYRAAVVTTCRALGHRVTGGAPRRSFATIQHYLPGVDQKTIAKYICHGDSSAASTRTYIKTLPDSEIRCLRQHPHLFRPIRTHTCRTSGMVSHTHTQ